MWHTNIKTHSTVVYVNLSIYGTEQEIFAENEFQGALPQRCILEEISYMMTQEK